MKKCIFFLLFYSIIHFNNCVLIGHLVLGYSNDKWEIEKGIYNNCIFKSNTNNLNIIFYLLSEGDYKTIESITKKYGKGLENYNSKESKCNYSYFIFSELYDPNFPSNNFEIMMSDLKVQDFSSYVYVLRNNHALGTLNEPFYIDALRKKPYRFAFLSSEVSFDKYNKKKDYLIVRSFYELCSIRKMDIIEIKLMNEEIKNNYHMRTQCIE